MERERSVRAMTTERRAGGFTLIELLIVVAIIAILAAIAVPNFLEAQTRAKVSRAKADLRTVVTALESYAVDHNDYPPNDGYYNILPFELTTPIAYVQSIYMMDPFSFMAYDDTLPEADRFLLQFYSYHRILTLPEMVEVLQEAFAQGRTSFIISAETVDAPGWNEGALERYGKFRLVSNGPDRVYRDPEFSPLGATPQELALQGSDVLYDPTNGTVSMGNVLWLHKGGLQN